MTLVLAWMAMAMATQACDCGGGRPNPPGMTPDGGPDSGRDGELPQQLTAMISMDPRVVPFGRTSRVTLDGSGSSAPDGSPLQYMWLVPGAQVVEGDLTSVRVTIEVDGSETVPVGLTVTDGQSSASATDQIQIVTVPVASAGLSHIAQLREVVELDGSASRDRADLPLTYEWTVIDSPAGSEPDLQDMTGMKPRFSAGMPGEYEISLIVNNGYLSSAPAVTTVRVLPESYDPPEVTLTVEPLLPAVGERVDLQVSASGATPIVETLLAINGTLVELDGSGHGTFTPTRIGAWDARGLVRDANGSETERTVTFFSHSGADNGAPTVSISSPVEGALFAGGDTVTGTVSDADLVRYFIEARREGGTEWNPIGIGSSPVSGGPLAPVDTSLLVAGEYDLRVRAQDSYGHEGFDQRRIVLDAQAPIGNYKFTVIDLRLTIGGMPVTISRTYDSAHGRRGDFGENWTYNYGEAKPEITNRAGDGWTFDGNCVFSATVTELKPHFYTFRFDGRPIQFRFSPEFSGCISGAAIYIARFAPASDTSGLQIEAEADGAEIALVSGSDQFYQWDGFGANDVFDPAWFSVRLRDGTTVRVHADEGMQSMSDAAGNTMMFSPTGITFSNGQSIVIERDGQDRITAITRPNGATRRYVYNSAGDLTQAIGFEGETTTYFYGAHHRLRSIVDASGNTILTTEYDPDGRIAWQQDVNGARVSMDYEMGDMAHRRVDVTDPEGRRSSTELDENGLKTRETFETGGSMAYEYTDDGLMRTATDPLGRTLGFEYNAQGERLSTHYASGVSINTTRDSLGRIMSQTDGEGHTESFQYDATGHITQFTNVAGQTFDFTYDTRGIMTSMGGSGGGTFTMTPDAMGHIARVVGPNGQGSDIESDAEGNPIRTRRMEGGRMVETNLAYDGNSRMVGMMPSTGAGSSVEYAPTGRIDGVTDALGGGSRGVYDRAGRLVADVGADGLLATRTFNMAGEQVEETNSAGGIRRYIRDERGLVVREELSGGGEIRRTFDDVGRMTSETNAAGLVTSYFYDDLGRVSRTSTNMGGSQRYEYDSFNNLVGLTDENGMTTTMSYDAMQRLVGIQRGGRSGSQTYDPNGNVTTATDAVGSTTRFDYENGRLIAVTDPTGVVSRQVFGTVGVESWLDPEGHMTSFQRDDQGRMVRRTLPSGRAEGWRTDYDTGEVTHTAFDGTQTIAKLGADRRVEEMRANDEWVRFTYDHGEAPAVIASSAYGSVTHLYDGVGNLVAQMEPTGVSVTREFDMNGQLVSYTTPSGSVRYTLDQESRIREVVGVRGDSTAIVYNSTGQVLELRYPNGVREIREYDERNELARISVRAADGTALLDEQATRDDLGRLASVTDQDGRTTRYAYDDLNRLTEESTTTAAGATSRTRYGYDRAGNLTMIDRDGSAQTFRYDVDNQLVSDGVATYTHDGNGRLTAIVGGPRAMTLAYDPFGNLLEVRTTGAELGMHVIRYGYDGRNLLVSRDVDGVATSLVQDRANGVPHVLEEHNADGTTAYNNIVAGDTVLARVGADGQHFLHRDLRGNVRLTTSDDGTASPLVDYSGFGVPSRPIDDSQTYAFGGERFDPITQMVYLRARWYMPSIGRFTAMDAKEPDFRDPQSLNRYTYARNNPLIFSDPTGREFSITGLLGSMGIQTGMRGLQNQALSKGMQFAAVIIGQVMAIGMTIYWLFEAFSKPAAGFCSFSGQPDATMRGIGGAVGPLGIAASISGGFGGPALLTGALTLASAATGYYVIGKERLRFNDPLKSVANTRVATYWYDGWGWGNPTGAAISGYLGEVWDCPTPNTYLGDFISVSINIDIFLVQLLLNGVGVAMGVFMEPLMGFFAMAGMVAAGPGPTMAAVALLQACWAAQTAIIPGVSFFINWFFSPSASKPETNDMLPPWNKGDHQPYGLAVGVGYAPPEINPGGMMSGVASWIGLLSFSKTYYYAERYCVNEANPDCNLVW